MFLFKLIKKLNKNNIDYALVGGHAVAIHGAVRGTMDVDLVLKWSLQTLEELESVMKSMNLLPRLPISARDVFYFKEEYIKNRNLIAWNFYNPTEPSEQVDIIITHDLSKLNFITVDYQNTPIKVISKKDLIQMKKDSGRAQDLLDIEALEKL
ncbi:MAG: hypothetical protein L3J52_06115 [Proteobacteria bacterium]|nr:hypothetical protein [Pseudomonadota bacterium]